MASLERMIQELARLQAPQRSAADSSPYVHMLEGVVTGVHLGGVDVQIRGQVNSARDIPYITSYTPGWGDKVWILRWGSDMFVLGDLVPAAQDENIVGMEDWHVVGASGEPGFNNSWINYGAGWSALAFAKQADGWVRLKGLVKNGTTLGSIFTLPIDYRPPFLWGATVLSNDANCSVTIQSNGTVAGNSGVNNAYICLDGIMWPTVDAWERERDTHWFPLVRSQNGWTSDTAFDPIDVFAQIYRRPDGFRYLKGNIENGTSTDHVGIAFSDIMPEDCPLHYERMAGHEVGGGLALIDVGGTEGRYNRVMGGSIGRLILVNLHYWSRQGQNILSVDPSYPNKSMQVWEDISFINGWANYNIGTPSTVYWQPCQYFKDDFGIVHLRGLANGAGKTSNIFSSIPVGYRPAEQQLFPTAVNGEVSGRINVYPNGNLEVFNAPAGWASLNGPMWKAEQ